MTIRVAAYLDQIDNDFNVACAQATKLGITDICIRRIGNTDISNLSPEVHDRLREALSTNQLRVVLIDSKVGEQITHLNEEVNNLEKICQICNAYNCQQLTVKLGKRTRVSNVNVVKAWIEAVSTKTLTWAIQPLYHLSADGAVTDPAVIAGLLQSSKRWRLVYDPAGLVVGNSNHLTKYWSLLNSKVWGLEFNDALPGSGRCDIGDGYGRLDVLLSEWARHKTMYLVLKPNLRYNTVIWPQFVEYLDQIRQLAARIGVTEQLAINWPGKGSNVEHD